MDSILYKVQIIAEEFIKKGEPLGWFERVYAEAEGDSLSVPWARMSPNFQLAEWLTKNHDPEETGKKALVVGCGLGDDAEELARRGFQTTAFDISPTAVDWCRSRFPQTKVDYRTVDLFGTPPEWDHAFDLVFEAYTLQNLQQPLRQKAMERMAKFVGYNGKLLVLTRSTDLNQVLEGPPWALLKAELGTFKKCGLDELELTEFEDPADATMRRFRAVYTATDPRLAAKP